MGNEGQASGDKKGLFWEGEKDLFQDREKGTYE